MPEKVRKIIRREVVRAPTPPPIIRRIYVRAPTPEPEVIEKVRR